MYTEDIQFTPSLSSLSRTNFPGCTCGVSAYTWVERPPNPVWQQNVPHSAPTLSLCVQGRYLISRGPLPRQGAAQVGQHPGKLQPKSFQVLLIKGCHVLSSLYQRVCYIYAYQEYISCSLRQWLMVLPLSKSTFCTAGWIPSHIPFFLPTLIFKVSLVQKCELHLSICAKMQIPLQSLM